MPESLAFDGYGVVVAIGDGGSTEVFTPIAEVTEASLPGYSKDTIDVSHASSPNKFREFIAGMLDAGEVTFAMNMVQADYAALLALFKLEAKNNYKLTIPDGNYTTAPTIIFAAHITGLPGDVPTQDKVSVNVTFKITGEPTYTQGT